MTYRARHAPALLWGCQRTPPGRTAYLWGWRSPARVPVRVLSPAREGDGDDDHCLLKYSCEGCMQLSHEHADVAHPAGVDVLRCRVHRRRVTGPQ